MECEGQTLTFIFNFPYATLVTNTWCSWDQLKWWTHHLVYSPLNVTNGVGICVQKCSCWISISIPPSDVNTWVISTIIQTKYFLIYLSLTFHTAGEKNPQTSIESKQIQNHLLSPKLVAQPYILDTKSCKRNTRLNFPSCSAQTLGVFLLVQARLLSHVVACDSRGFAT
jgi:hypothetical protein